MGMPTVVSLFAGCGGSSLGYRMAGYGELLAVEWDANAVKTFKLNFTCPIWQRDIRKLTGKQILKFCKTKEIDVLDGSPPCQGFSTAGKRRVSDERNDLVRHYIRLVGEMRPKVFVMENVSGMIKGKMKGLFNEYLRMMLHLDYNVKCKLMDSKYYGVPQSRKRLIWVGINKECCPKNDWTKVFPTPNRKTITAKEAFNGLIIDNDDLKETKLKNIALELWWKCKPGNNFSTVHPKKYWFNANKLSPNKPSRTITKMAFKGGMGNGMFHYSEPRLLTIKELKRLHSFPDDFKFTDEFYMQWARIGNSVPPLMMYEIAKSIKENVLNGTEM